MSVVSNVQIANMALGHIGARDNIESFDDNRVEAKAVSIWFDHCRVKTLEAFDWTFARRRRTLALDSEDAPEDWGFRYQYPDDCLKARSIVNPYFYAYGLIDPRYSWAASDLVPFQIEMSSDLERKTILTDMDDAVLLYTANVSDPSMFTNEFVSAFSYALASDIAYKLTGKNNLKEAMYKQFVYQLAAAQASDANEQGQRRTRDAIWIRGR